MPARLYINSTINHWPQSHGARRACTQGIFSVQFDWQLRKWICVVVKIKFVRTEMSILCRGAPDFQLQMQQSTLGRREGDAGCVRFINS